MPILHVRALPSPHPFETIQKSLQNACVAIAQAYGCKPEQVWGTWEELKPGHYVEGRNAAHEQPSDSHPPIAELIAFEGKDAETIERVLLAASQALGTGLGIPGNLFIRYTEAQSGRVIAGDGAIRR